MRPPKGKCEQGFQSMNQGSHRALMRKEAWVVVHCCLGKVCARCGGWWHTPITPVLWRHGKMYLHGFKTSLFYILSYRSVKVYIVSF